MRIDTYRAASFFVVCWLNLAPAASYSDENQITELRINGTAFQAPLQEVPSSATVLKPSQEGVAHNSNFQEWIPYVPNLNWAGGTNRPRFFQIRGVGEFEQYSGAPNPSVATIVDDLDFSGLGIITSLFDVEQIEIMRGPQATRFGSSALAGVLHMRSEEPTPYFTSRGQLSAGSDDLLEGGLALGGPLEFLDKAFQFRASLHRNYSNGYRQNDFFERDDTNERDELSARLKLRYEPSRRLRIDLSGLNVHNDNGYDPFTIDNSFVTQADRPGKDAIRAKGGVVKVSARPWQNLELISTTTAYVTDQDYSFDGDWGNNPFWGEFAPYDFFEGSERERKVYSQELRLSSYDTEYEHGKSLRWLAGIFGQKLYEDTFTEQFSEGEVFNSIDSSYRADTTALFGELEVPLHAGTSLGIGARAEVRDANYYDDRESDLSLDDEMWGGSISLNHDLAEHKRVYALIARGFKGGGINSGPRVPAELRIYTPENLWSYELGFKGEWLERALTTNVALFHAERRDLQLKFALQDDPSDPLSFTYITQSEARGEAHGMELDLRYNLTPAIQLFGTGALLHSEFTSVPAGNADLLSRDFSHAPQWQYSAGSVVRFTPQIFLRAEIIGMDSFYFDDSHNQSSEPYHIVNLLLGLKQANWSWTFWGRNIFDRKYATRGFFFGNEPPDFPNKRYIQLGDPAQFGTTLTFHF